jgi:hypothetical protein
MKRTFLFAASGKFAMPGIQHPIFTRTRKKVLDSNSTQV